MQELDFSIILYGSTIIKAQSLKKAIEKLKEIDFTIEINGIAATDKNGEVVFDNYQIEPLLTLKI